MMGIVNGALVFNEFTPERMGPLSHYVYFFLGCALCLLGILALMLGGPSKSADEESDEQTPLVETPSDERSCADTTRRCIPYTKENLPAKLSKTSQGPSPADRSHTFEPAEGLDRLETPALRPKRAPDRFGTPTATPTGIRGRSGSDLETGPASKGRSVT